MAAEAVVVGAGPAGLAVAAGLRGIGVDALVIDRAASVGSAWTTRYDSFHLHTIRWLSNLPGMAMPARFGSWVARDDFVAYLHEYADRFGVRPRLGVAVEGLERRRDGWRLDTSDGPVDARRVILATGACNTPYTPNWPGAEEFTRLLVHSSDYRNPTPYLRADRHDGHVLVVGSGNSATEIAMDLATAGVAVEMAVRTAPVIVRRDTAGIPSQLIGIASRRVPARIMDPLGHALRRATVPDLTAYGLPAPARPMSQFATTQTVPVIDQGFVDAVRSGLITIRPGVTGFVGTEVVHADGSRSHPDAVIAATGYRAGLEPLLGGLGLLDAHGLPTVGAAGREGLHTVGISITLSGLLREIGQDARRVVRAVGRGHS